MSPRGYDPRSPQSPRPRVNLRAGVVTAIAATVIVIFLMLIFGTWYTVDQSERGIVTMNGAYQSTAGPGLHFKLPWVQEVTKVSLQQQATNWPCHDGACLQAYSKDQQPADLQVSVIWHILPDAMEQFYTQYGADKDALISRLIARKVPQDVKTTFGQYSAQSAIELRAKLNADVMKAVQDGIDTGAPLAIDSVQIENIDYSDAYEQSVEQSKLAEVEVRKRQQELEQQKIAAQITVTQAQAQADSQLAVAKANALAVEIQGKATAAAIKARGDALKDNPGLVALTQAEKWDGRLPTTMLPGGAVPMINVMAQP